MRVYVVGSVASGKTTFAKRLSEKTGIKCTHLDGLVHIKDETDKDWGNRRRTDEEIERIFGDLLLEEKWILEDAGRPMFMEAMQASDVIIHLNPSPLVRRKRLITRFVKQKLGLEYSIYRPNKKMFKFLWQAANKYDSGEDDLELRLKKYTEKLVHLTNNRALDMYLKSL